MTFRYTLTRFGNTLWIYVICIVLSGAYLYQYFNHITPSPLNLLQRLAMISMGLGPLLNLKFGIKPGHYGLALLFALLGGSIALYQSAYFPGGIPVFTLQLYTWSFIVFSASILGCALLLTLSRPNDSEIFHRLTLFEALAFLYLTLLTLANAITAYLQCGFGPCQ